MKTQTKLLPLAISIALSSPAFAASFSIGNDQEINTTQTLNDNEAGTIDEGGLLNISLDNVPAILAPGDGVTIINSGSIITNGLNSDAIFSQGQNTSISNHGSITTNGFDSKAISASGDNSSIGNSGDLSTSGDNSYVILSAGDNSSVSNTGSIFSTGVAARGINITGNSTNIYNSGRLLTTGLNGIGIFSAASDTHLDNSGSITTSGNNASGVVWSGVNASIINTGSITTTGDSAHAIYAFGADATITNSGLISATGNSSYAILGNNTATNFTLNLQAGSQIFGRVDLGAIGDNDTVNIYDVGSANLTFENVENINLFGTGTIMGNTVVTTDPTGESTRGVALANMTSSIHNLIARRMARTTPLKPVQLASLELSPGMYFEEHKPVAWAQVFGGNFDRDAEGSALAYDHDHIGVNFGYEWDMKAHRVGLMGGIVHSTTDTQTASFDTEADNYYLGAYANRKMNGFNITGSLLAGYGDHDNDRLVLDNINGFEVAKSDFDSWFISPGLTVGSAFTVADRLELRPSVSVNYSIAWLDDYRESGTTNSNLSVNDRKAKALTARAQLAAAYQFDEASEFEFRVGINSRHTDDDDTNVGIAGSQFKFATAGDENVTGGFAGASLRVAAENNLSLVADMEFGGDSDENYVAGQISLEYVF